MTCSRPLSPSFMRTFVTFLPLAGMGWVRLSVEQEILHLLSIVIRFLAEINLPGSCVHWGWKWEAPFRFTKQESCTGRGRGRENQDSLAWPLGWVMLYTGLGIALAPTQGESWPKLCCLSSYNISRSDLKGWIWRREKEDKFRGGFS